MRTFFLYSVILCATSFLTGCSSDPAGPGADTGTLQISLTDAPANLQAVNITFAEISAHIDSSWITVQGDTTTVNLLEWNNGRSIVLGREEVPAGHYTQIRLKIIRAEVMDANGTAYEADVPSGSRTGLKLLSNFTVMEGTTFELVLDFDADRSIVTTGPHRNPTGYKLKPTIRVTSRATTGTISGLVLNPRNFPIATALAGADTVTSTAVDTTTGRFSLAFLPAGIYSVVVADSSMLSYRGDGIEVIAGNDTDLGSVTLTP